jgi:hypothetical protein
MPRYLEIPLHDLPQKPSRELLHQNTAVTLPAVAFGCEPESLRMRGKLEAAQTWGAGRFRPLDVFCWTIKDALVHGPNGIVTIEDRVIKESLLRVPFGTGGYSREANIITLPETRPTRDVGSGWHAASGAHVNYYHWMMDILLKVQAKPLGDKDYSGMLLMPPQITHFQRETAALLADCGYSILHLKDDESVNVQQLAFVPNMTGAGFNPHPAVVLFFTRMAEAIRPRALPARRLYISRVAAKRRKLANESEVIAFLRSAGYEICDTARYSIREQIELFASASHVVAPHGAGLVNLLFCTPGANVLELQMDAYMNLCFRRIAALKNLHYGCIVGDYIINSGATGLHSGQWLVDIDRLQRALAKMP